MIRFLLVGILLWIAWPGAQCRATSFVSAVAWPLLPGEETRLENCEGRVFDSGTVAGVVDGADMRYRLFKPVNYDASQQYPVIVWLHGSGMEGINNTAQLTTPSMLLINRYNREHFPCFFIAPQRQTGEWYSGNKTSVFGIITDVAAQYSIDPKRIYLVGISYGAFGTFAFLTNNAAGDPWHFAAGSPVSGNGGQSGALSKAAKLVDFPIWTFHSADDGTVDVTGDDDIMNKIRSFGGTPMYTRYQSGSHSENCWNSAWGSPQFMPWLMAQRLKDTTGNKRETSPQPPGVIITGYRVGAALDVQGTADDNAGVAGVQVGWWSSRVSSRNGTGISTGGATLTIAAEHFTSADIGSRVLITDTRYDCWDGYLITAVGVSGTTCTVSPAMPSYTNVNYELCPPGHRRNPKAVTTGTASWTVSGIPMSAGTNTIGVTARGPSLSTLGGNLFEGGRPLNIVFATPSGDTEAPQLTVTGPSSLPRIVTSSSTVILSGTASDNNVVSRVDWTSDLTATSSGTAAGTTSWVTGQIPLGSGNNVIIVKAYDSAGNVAAQIVTVMCNQAPTPGTDEVTTPGDTGRVIDVLANDTDPDGQPLNLTLTGIATSPSHGTVTMYGTQIRYLPTPGYRGVDSFDYTVTDGVTPATGHVTVTVNGTVSNAETIYFSQDFSSSNDVNSYVSATPGAGQFNDISAEADGGQWSINGGRLTLVRTGLSGTNNGAGLTRFTDLPGMPQFVKVSFDFTLTGVTASGAALALDLCNVSSFSDYSGSTPSKSVQNRISLDGKGAGIMSYSNGGASSIPTVVDGLVHKVDWYVNASQTETKQYRGGDGFLHDVSPNQSSLWVDDVVVYDNTPRWASYTGTILSDFRIGSGIASPCTLTFDNFKIAEHLFSIGADPQPPSEIANWRQIHGLASDGTQDLGTPAGDGVANLVKYALNMAPKVGDLAVPANRLMVVSGTAGLPRTDVNGQGQVVFSFVRRKMAVNSELTYVVEQSSNLTGWSPCAATPTVVSIDSTWERVSYVVDSSPSATVFLRLKIQHP